MLVNELTIIIILEIGERLKKPHVSLKTALKSLVQEFEGRHIKCYREKFKHPNNQKN